MELISTLFITMSLKYGLPPNLLSSLCWVESNHKVTAINYADGDADSLGVCQIKLRTAREMGFQGTAKQLMNPKMNIKYAAKYLAWQYKRYGSISRAVVAYNRGNARGLTTSSYQRKVFSKWNEGGGINVARNTATELDKVFAEGPRGL